MVTAFTLPASATGLTVPVTALSATDDQGVTGYLISESASAPAASAAGWSSTPSASFTFAGSGLRTAYAWARDAAGNVSASRSAQVIITLPDLVAPSVTSFTMPLTANTPCVVISELTAADNVGVTGYFLSENSAAPEPAAAGWSATVPASFTFAGSGSRTVYAWVKDATGNVSAWSAATVLIDTVLPAISSMTLASGSASLTIKVSAFDNVAVTKMELYLDDALQLETSGSAFVFVVTISNDWSRAVTVKIYDAAGNVRSQSLRVTRS